MKKSEFKNIIKEELKLLSEGYGPFPNPDIDLEQMAMAIGYTSFDDFLNENPGAKKAIIDWTLTIPDFASSLKRKGLNEGTSRDAFIKGWEQSKANLGKGKIKGDLKDIDAWTKHSNEELGGKGSKEEKEAFLDGWFKARTTSDLKDIDAWKEYSQGTGVDYISVNIKKDGGFLKNVKGKVEPTDIGFIIYNEKNDGKPYNIIWDKKRNKFINGETIWYNVEDVIPTSGYEDIFSKLKKIPFA